MIFHILNSGKLVKIVKTFPEVARYMKANHPTKRGFSAKTLRKFDFTAGIGTNGVQDISDYTKGDIIVRQVDETADRKIVRQLKKNYLSTANTHTIRYRNYIGINVDEISIVVKKVMDKIQTIDNVDNKVFDVIITEQNNDQTISTGYKGYNQVFEDLLKKLQDYFKTYEAQFNITTIIINEMTMPPAEEQIIYKKLNNKRVDMATKDDTYDIIFDIEYRMLYLDADGSNTTKNKYLKIFKKYRIINPNTYKNCLYYAAFMSIFDTEDKSVIKNAMGRFKNDNKDLLQYNLQDLKLILNNNTGYRFVIYFLGHNKIEKIKIGEKLPDTKKICLMIKGNHAYLMIKQQKGFKFEYDTKLNDVLVLAPKQEQDIDYTKINIMTYDMETCNKNIINDDKTNIETQVYAVGYYDGKECKTIFKKNERHDVLLDFIDVLRKIEKDTIIYGHNAGKFDAILLLPTILKAKGLYVKTFLESNGRIINLQIVNKKKANIFFRDSYNFICMSLNDACNSFKNKTPKLKGDVEHDLINANNCRMDGEKINEMNIKQYVNQYLINDCISLHEILLMFNDIIYNAYKFTIYETLTNAGIARKVFLTKYYKDNIYYLSKITDYNLRKYYYGGRNECFSLKKIEGKIYYVDYTSLYPHVMHKYKYPTGEINIINEPSVENINEYFGFIDCKFRHIHKNCRPLHAVVNNNKLTFSHFDNWERSILSSEEIKYSIENNLGYEYEFIKVYNYETKEYIFKEMITDLFKMKFEAEKSGNAGLRQIAKIIANSSYGFFGINYRERTQSKIERIDNSEEGKRDLEHQIFGYINNQMLKSVDYKEDNQHSIYRIEAEIRPNCANVGLASMICSNARIELYKLMRAIDLKNGEVYYCDTDSCITNYNIYADSDFKDFIGTNTALLGELTNEMPLEKLLSKDNDKKQVTKILKNYTGDDAPHFQKAVICANKFYYMKSIYKINDKTYKKEIIKMKGMNSNLTYDNRTVNDETKEIIYSGLNKEGKYKICELDYDLLIDGYSLTANAMGFKTAFKNTIMNKKGILKTYNDKRVEKIYTKGNVDSEGNITPFSL